LNEIFKQVAASVVASLIAAFLGQWALTRSTGNGKLSAGRVSSVRLSSVVIGLAVFYFLWSSGHGGTGATPILQSLQAKPNYVQKGGRVTVTLQLDKPAPKDISVALTTSDPAILPLDGDVTVPEGSNMATVYSTAISAPDYVAPVVIYASYQDVKKRTQVNVAGQLSGPKNPSDPAPALPQVHNTIEMARRETSPVVTLPPKPAPLSGELLSRLEEVQGRLSAEQSYWEGVRSHMPAGSSLRPEITSQLYAARSAGQRCSKDQQSQDAADLSSCIDSLNDHLNQLSIQH